MKKILFSLFLCMAALCHAQNDDCSGATQLTVGTEFNSEVITASNMGATTDGDLPSCRDNAVDNVWFTVVVPPSGNIKIETREADNSLFDDSVLTVYSGTCNSLTEIDCNDDYNGTFSRISLTGQTPGTTLYISVWKYDSYIDNGEFQISAYDPIPPANDNCPGAIPLTVGTDFNSGMIIANNTGATTDGDLPSCSDEAADNVWFTVVVPPSGNIKIETREADNSLFDDSVLTVYSGTCNSLTEIDCNDDGGADHFSMISLTGQTPGAILYISVWKYSSNTDNGEFQISAYDPIPPANDNCPEAIPLTVGTDFNSGMIIANNTGATTDGDLPSCDDEAIENIWFTAVVPASGNIKIEMRETDNSLFDDAVLAVYSGTCGSLTEIECNDYGFSGITLTGQTPGATLYISVWKYNSYINNGEFQISAYDPIPPANDNCPEAIPLTVGTDFNSGMIIANNTGATTDGDLPSCDDEAIENIWFTAVVPASGNIKIEMRKTDNSLFDDAVLAVYSGTCGSLTEIECNDYVFFSGITLTGQTPGATLYISVWKYDSYIDNGEFQISAYDNTMLSTHEVTGQKRKITLYPNPFNDQIAISDITKVKTIMISDSSGRLIKTIESPPATIHLNDLKAGMYFITLKMKDGTLETIKTIKK